MKILYFAWVRERAGRAEEEIDLPTEVETVRDLIAWLRARDADCDHAFERPEIIRVAVDHVHAGHEARLSGAKEVAFFPPMTGG